MTEEIKPKPKNKVKVPMQSDMPVRTKVTFGNSTVELVPDVHQDAGTVTIEISDRFMYSVTFPFDKNTETVSSIFTDLPENYYWLYINPSDLK